MPAQQPEDLSPEKYCRRCDLFRPCFCDEQRDPNVDAATANPGVVKPKSDQRQIEHLFEQKR